MGKYVVQRVLLSIPTIVAITAITFFGLRILIPESAIDVLVGEFGRTDPQFQDKLEKDLGLDGSILSQYFKWSGVSWFWGGSTGILQGDLGESIRSGRPVASDIASRGPVSFELAVAAQTIAVVLFIPMGIWAALRQDDWPDYGLRSFGILIAALPGFWIAVLIITFGSIWFNWAPPLQFTFIQDDPLHHLKIMMLPALLLSLASGGIYIRLSRTQMLDVMRQDYVRTAHSKGLKNSTVIYQHAFRNALIPIVTVIGLSLPNVIAGTVIFEQVFTIPGMGRYLVEAVNFLDYPVIQALVLVYAVLLLVSVLLIDLSYAYLDPRIKYS